MIPKFKVTGMTFYRTRTRNIVSAAGFSGIYQSGYSDGQGISSIGVIQSVMKKRKIQCACLGTVFNLPMSTVAIIEKSSNVNFIQDLTFIVSSNKVFSF